MSVTLNDISEESTARAGVLYKKKLNDIWKAGY